MFASYKVLLNGVEMNTTPLHSNFTLIDETILPHPLYYDIDYSKNRVVQKRTQFVRSMVARMVLRNGSPGIVAIFWAKVVSS